MDGEIHDHDDVGEEDKHGGVGFGNDEVIEELDILAIVVIDIF